MWLRVTTQDTALALFSKSVSSSCPLQEALSSEGIFYQIPNGKFLHNQ